MYFHSPIEFRLIKYQAPELGPLIPQVERKKAAPMVHKTLPELSTPKGRARAAILPPRSEAEAYRQDHERLTRLELHHLYQQVRNLWDRQQFHPEQRPLHIGLGQDGSETAAAAQESARFLASKYHSQITELSNWHDDRGRLQLPDTPHAFSLLVLPRTENDIMASLIAQAPCPVLVQCGFEPLKKLKKILVPADGTAFCYPALAQAFICCEDFGSELNVLHVATAPAKQLIEHEDLTHRIAQLAWHAIEHDVLTVSGDVVQQILAYALIAHIDLVILGTHRLTEHNAPSLTPDLIKSAALPVWVLHPEHG